MNNNPFEQPTNPASPELKAAGRPPAGGPPVNPPPANPMPATPPPATPVSPQGGSPANPFATPNPKPVEPQPEPAQPVPIVSKTGPNVPPPGNQNAPDMYQPVGNDPSGGGKKLLVLIIILVIILVLGGLFFASWQGWISLGGIEKYWKGTPATNTNVNANTNTSTVNANDKQRKTDLANIKTALTAYFQANQSYPVATVEEKTSDPNSTLNVLIPTYLASLPVDPLSPAKYYGYQSDGKTYTLTAVLEDVTDPLGIQVGNFYIYKVTNTSVETPQATNSNANSNTNSI